MAIPIRECVIWWSPAPRWQNTLNAHTHTADVQIGLKSGEISENRIKVKVGLSHSLSKALHSRHENTRDFSGRAVRIERMWNILI